jgi:3-oxoacyl-[acyl-carrier-protein] synthase II
VRPLAVTGVGVVSPLGLGFAAVRAALDGHQTLGQSAFRSSTSVMSKEKIPDPMVAEVWDFDPTPFLGSKGLRNHDRFTLMLLVAAKQALEDAGLKKDGNHVVYPAERVGICSATAYGALDSINELVEVSELQDPRFLNPSRFPNTVINSAAGYVSIWEDLRAPNVTVVDGNCGALDAVLTCETHLCNGRADAFIVGGGEVLSEPLYLAFRKLDALADRGRIYAPGHASGQGMRLGEAATYLTIERQAEAERRGARVYGRILGYGNTFEPPDSEAQLVHASERSIERAVRMAIEDAGVATDSIDLVCASANGMAPFDRGGGAQGAVRGDLRRQRRARHRVRAVVAGRRGGRADRARRARAQAALRAGGRGRLLRQRVGARRQRLSRSGLTHFFAPALRFFARSLCSAAVTRARPASAVSANGPRPPSPRRYAR